MFCCHVVPSRTCGIYASFFHGSTAIIGPGPPLCRGCTITLSHTTFSWTPLEDWSAHHRYLYLTTHNSHNRQTSMFAAGFEPAIPGGERPQTHALHHVNSGIGWSLRLLSDNSLYTSAADIVFIDSLLSHPTSPPKDALHVAGECHYCLLEVGMFVYPALFKRWNASGCLVAREVIGRIFQ